MLGTRLNRFAVGQRLQTTITSRVDVAAGAFSLTRATPHRSAPRHNRGPMPAALLDHGDSGRNSCPCVPSRKEPAMTPLCRRMTEASPKGTLLDPGAI